MDAGLPFPPYLNDRLAFKESSLKAVGTVDRPNVQQVFVQYPYLRTWQARPARVVI